MFFLLIHALHNLSVTFIYGLCKCFKCEQYLDNRAQLWNIYLTLNFNDKIYLKFNISHILSIKILNIQSQNYLILYIVVQNITKPAQCISKVFQQYQGHVPMIWEILMWHKP
jgi:hypothetical protein